MSWLTAADVVDKASAERVVDVLTQREAGAFRVRPTDDHYVVECCEPSRPVSRIVAAPKGQAKRTIFRQSSSPRLARNGMWTSVTVVSPVL